MVQHDTSVSFEVKVLAAKTFLNVPAFRSWSARGSLPKTPKSDFRRSNRDQTEASNSSSESLTYDAPMRQRWDTTDLASILCCQRLLWSEQIANF
jgi:hypothetical protein